MKISSMLVNCRFVFLGIALSLTGMPSYATDMCHQEEDDAKRLACYDNAETDKENRSASKNRKHEIAASLRNPFSLTPYRMNYMLPITHNSSTNEEPFQDFFEQGESVDNKEAKFQISVQFEPWGEVGDSGIAPYFTYTQLALWQVYNTDISSPFRETNYEPEFGIRFNPGWNLFGMKSSSMRVGFNHQSNGRGEPLSRSWDRIYATFAFERGDFVTVFRPWMRIEEDDEDDDNPDIEDFLGNFEWYGFYKHNDFSYGLMLRNNFDSGDDNRGAYQIDFTFPLPYTDIKWYIQYFNGYGESLVDYNHRTNRIGFGVALIDWL